MPVSSADVESILDRVQEWTRAADQKAIGIAVLQTAVPAILADSLAEWWTSPELAGYKVVVALAAILWAISLGFATITLIPRPKNKAGVSVTFFGNIASWSLEEYRKRLNALDDDGLRHDHINQVWVCADICMMKHRFAKWAVIFFAGSAALMLGAYAVRGWMN